MLRSFPRSVRAAVLLASAAAAGVLLSAATPSPDFEDRVFAQLNRFRADPADYTRRLATYRPRYRGKLLVGVERGQIDILTEEGVAAVDEAIRDLRAARPVPPLERSELLARVAADHVAVQSRSGATGHVTGGRRSDHRMELRGGGPHVNEVITYGHHGPASVVDQLLIDDGVADRGHRIALLRDTHRYAGVACGPHKSYRTMCVILMSPTADGHPPARPAAKPR